jgi:hypothetical protein
VGGVPLGVGCVCCVGLYGRGASVLVFFGECTPPVISCGGGIVGSDAVRLDECVGGMFWWMGIARSVRAGLGGVVEVGPSV